MYFVTILLHVVFVFPKIGVLYYSFLKNTYFIDHKVEISTEFFVFILLVFRSNLLYIILQNHLFCFFWCENLLYVLIFFLLICKVQCLHSYCRAGYFFLFLSSSPDFWRSLLLFSTMSYFLCDSIETDHSDYSFLHCLTCSMCFRI